MKRRIILILTLALFGALAASARGGQRVSVAAGFYPLAFAAQQVGGRAVDVHDLTPAGTEPHDLEVTPDAVRTIASADLVLLLGHGFQPQLERAAGSGSRVLRLLDTHGLRLAPNGDPHVWLDPRRFALVVRRVARALHRPAGPLLAELAALDRDYRRGLASCRRHELVTTHEAFGYLAQRYGLRQVAITGLAPESEPSPRTLQRVVETVRRTHATTVFTEPLTSPKLAQTVAREAHARTAVLDPIEGLTPDERRAGDDYLTLMRRDLHELRRALGCR